MSVGVSECLMDRTVLQIQNEIESSRSRTRFAQAFGFCWLCHIFMPRPLLNKYKNNKKKILFSVHPQ